MISTRNMTSVYIFRGDEVLLIHRVGSRVFKGPLWCGVGGHFENAELNDPEACLLRELFEETSLTENDVANLRLKYITLRRKDDEIRQQYIFFAELANLNADLPECGEGELRWIKTDELSGLEMSFSNARCLEHYFKTGHCDDLVYAAAGEFENGVPWMVFSALRDYDAR